MHPIDWAILIGTLLFITGYGVYKTRGKQDMQTYLLGNKELKWWTIGLSIMATQASAVTFLSTTGQGYEDGMRFAQFYFGLPIAMVVLSAFFLPIYYRLKVYTAYEYLEQRFDLRVRIFTALLFLIQRGMAAGITIYAPGIVLSILMGWNLPVTIFLLSIFTIIYTVSGGGDAVSATQQQQMIVILSGLVVAFIIMLMKLPPNIDFVDALHIAGKMGKTNVVTTKFDLADRYNIWTGLLGGVFLFLSYFGTDQSQVQRYLSGETLAQSRIGLLFNGIIKVPMQFLVLSVGVMMFVFYQFNQSPIHFNSKNLASVQNSVYAEDLKKLEARQNEVFEAKRQALNDLVIAQKADNTEGVQQAQTKALNLISEDKAIRTEVKSLIKKADAKAEPKDGDYVFITFVLHHLPVGIVGLLLAVIFSAAMSSKSSEINALATTSVIDIYRRMINKNATDSHYMRVSQWLTAIWGFIAMAFAIFATFLDNLIEAVNIVGSLFYGTILGIFMVAFFMKKIGSKAVFWAAIIAEIIVVTIFILDKMEVFKFAYLWLNLVGCVLVMIFAYLFQALKKSDEKL